MSVIDGKRHHDDSLTKNPDYASFGVAYAKFLIAMNESEVNAKAQYATAVLALGLLQRDLNRDDNRFACAEAIIRIHDFLARMPTEPLTESDATLTMSMPKIRRVTAEAFSLVDQARVGVAQLPSE